MLPQINSKPDSLEKAYSDAVKFTKGNYENFPVVSFFLPKRIYKHVAIIYRFARTADDIADEGNMPAEEKMGRLNEFRQSFRRALDAKPVNELWRVLNGNPENEFWAALINTINQFSLSEENFFNLLKAFEMDLIKTEYASWSELLEYCKLSANPVGRIILELIGKSEERLFLLSDKICSALQVTNLIQDAADDLNKGRNYFPDEFIEKFAVDKNALYKLKFSDNIKDMIEHEIELLRKMYFEGSALLNYLPYKMKIEIGVTINGGLSVLDKIEKNNCDVFNNKVKLSKLDFVKLFTKTIITAA